MGEEIIILSNGEYLLLKRAIAKILYKKNYEQKSSTRANPNISNHPKRL